MPETGTSSKRSAVKSLLTPELIEALDFANWPVSPARLVGKKLVTEPTPAHVSEWTVRDTRTPGFGIRVYAGSKRFFVQRKSGGSTSRRFNLFAQNSLTDARNQAGQWYAAMVDPEFDPKKELKERAQVVKELRDVRRITFGHAFDDFIDNGTARVKNDTLRPKTLEDRQQVLRWMRKMDLWATPLIDVDMVLVEKTFAPLFGQAARTAQAHEETGVKPKRGGGAGNDVSAVYKCLAQDVTMGYLQGDEALEALRELYVTREKHLRKLVGQDTPAPEDPALSGEQRTALNLIRMLMKQAGLDAIPPE